MSSKIDRNTISRWRTARRITLSSIALAGSLATVASISHLMHGPCRQATEVQRHYTYSGIGVRLYDNGKHVEIDQVFPGTPADGKLFPGAVLVAVDGQHPANPGSMRTWVSQIKGEAGTEVELEVAYPCRGHETVTMTRDIIRVAR